MALWWDVFTVNYLSLFALGKKKLSVGINPPSFAITLANTARNGAE